MPRHIDAIALGAICGFVLSIIVTTPEYALWGAILLAAGLAGSGLYYWLVVRRKKRDTCGRS